MSVLKFALAARVAVWALGAWSGWLASPYDSSGALSGGVSAVPQSVADEWIDLLVRPFAHWDGVFFVSIAKEGYKYEQFHAFFPLLPLLIRSTSDIVVRPVLNGVGAPVSEHSSLLLAGFLLSNVAFVLSCWVFHALARLVLKNGRQARVATILFAWGPGGVFFSAVYTESLFALLSLLGLLWWEMSRVHRLPRAPASRCIGYAAAAALFSLASAVRSNGMLLVGFLLFSLGEELIGPPQAKGGEEEGLEASRPVQVHNGLRRRRRHADEGGWEAEEESTRARSSRGPWFLLRLLWVPYFFVLACIIFLPSSLFQWWAAWRYCSAPPVSLERLIPTNPQHPDRAWCPSAQSIDAFPWTLPPSLYTFVQAEYWSIGFLRYYELKQIPNFLLALPIFLTVWHVTVSFFEAHPVRRLFQWALSVASVGSRPFRSPEEDSGWRRWESAPYVLYTTGMAVIALLFMHVQVATRFLAASPAIYWYWSTFWFGRGQPDSDEWTRKAITLFCAAYSVLGATLFTTFYPWT